MSKGLRGLLARSLVSDLERTVRASLDAVREQGVLEERLASVMNGLSTRGDGRTITQMWVDEMDIQREWPQRPTFIDLKRALRELDDRQLDELGKLAILLGSESNPVPASAETMAGPASATMAWRVAVARCRSALQHHKAGKGGAWQRNHMLAWLWCLAWSIGARSSFHEDAWVELDSGTPIERVAGIILYDGTQVPVVIPGAR